MSRKNRGVINMEDLGKKFDVIILPAERVKGLLCPLCYQESVCNQGIVSDGVKKDNYWCERCLKMITPFGPDCPRQTNRIK